MSKKYFIVLGLFLAAGFLFSGAMIVKAETWTWTGGGDAHTWTDAKNWGLNVAATANSYPGATTTADVVIASNARVIATTTISTTGGLGSLTLGAAATGVSLNIAGDATIYASSTVSLLGTSTLAFGDNTYTTTVGGTSLALGAGNLYLGLYNVATTSYPLSIGQLATFTAGTSTVTYAGVGRAYIATTTYYNLSLTPTSTAATAIYTLGAGGNATSTHVLTIGQAAQLNMNGRQLELSGSGTPLIYVSDGSFVANNSTVTYSVNTTATNIATGTYATLVVNGSATKSLVGNTTALTAVTINSGATLAVSSYTFTATGATWINSGTVTEGTGKITLAAAGVLSSSAGGSAVTTFGNADTLPVIHVQVTDASLNLLASTAETQTATVIGTSGITDSETVTLTETSATSGVFRGSISFQLSGSNVVGKLDYQGNGTINYSFVDSQDSTDTESGSASFTGTMPGGGSSGSSGGGSSSAATATTVAATATPTTQTTVTAPAITTAPATAVSGPTLESVQTKVAGAIAKVAALSANPTASELAVVQAEIAAILADLQTLQTTAVPQGAVLGYNFVRPLALGMSHNDVSNLQIALKTDSSIYPSGKVTGYFGPATLLAVKKFQEKYGIASEGQAGYGAVGPKTRAKLNELYGAK